MTGRMAVRSGDRTGGKAHLVPMADLTFFGVKQVIADCGVVVRDVNVSFPASVAAESRCKRCAAINEDES